MKNLILFLCLSIPFFQTAEAQTACADFIAGNYTSISQENSFFGSTDVYHFKCSRNILLDPSCSIGAPSYHIRVAEFDLNTWTWTKDFYGGWELSPVPFTINVSNYFPPNEPTCGKIYAVGFVEGPTWNPADVLFFTIDCSSIPFEETYACKENLQNDSTSIDVAYDQLHLNDGTRVITGYTKLGSNVSLFIEKMNADGISLDKKQYPIQGDYVSNVQITYDKANNEFLLFFDTRVSNNSNIYLLNVNSTNLIPIQYHSKIVPETVSSHEYAVKIESHYDGEYVLLVNQSDGIVRNAYSVYVQRIGGIYAFSYNQVNINNSNNIYVYDVIETGGRIGNAGNCGNYNPSFLICGSVDNEAFLLGAGCFGSIYGKANVFDIDGNTNTTDPAKKIAYFNEKFYVAGETGTYSDFNTQISGKIWLGEFDVNHILSPTEYFSANNNWLTIYEQNSSKKESLIDLGFSDGYLYLTGQIGIEDFFVSVGNVVGPKAYVLKSDLVGNVVWSKAYYEQSNTESKINDIELVCGSIQGIGKCNERILNLDFPVSVSLTNQYIYNNKLNLNGLVAQSTCYHDVLFTKNNVNIPINERLSSSIGLSLIPVQLPPIYDILLCVKDCCSSVGEYCPPVIVLNENPIQQGIYSAAQNIESAGNITNNISVTFIAGQNIRLNSGFSVEAGATFSANIAPCDCNLPAPNNIIIDNTDADDIYLSWNAVPKAISYYIEYVIDGGSTTYHYTNNTNIVIPFVVGLDHQYTIFTDCGETGSQGPTVGFTNSAECIDCDPAENVDVTFENDSLVISWDGADNASFINFAFYDDMGNLIFFTEEINTPGAPGSTIILPNDFPGGVFPDVFEVGVSVTCDIPQQRSTFEPENNIGCHELRIIIIVSDDEPWKYGDYCGMPAERPYKILCSHTNFSVTMAKFQCMHCNSNGVGWQNESNVMDCKANCACN